MKISAFALVLASGMLSVSAHATTITNNDAFVTPTAGTFSGTMIATTSGDVVTASYTDPYTVSVYVDPSDTLTGCTGNCLVFAFHFTNPTADGIQSIALGNVSTLGFANYDSSIFYETAAAIDQAPYDAQEDSTGTIHVNFTPTIRTGTGYLDSSDTVYVETNAINYTGANFSTQDDIAGNAPGFVPAAPTPEPSSLILLGTGLAGLAGAARRKFRR